MSVPRRGDRTGYLLIHRLHIFAAQFRQLSRQPVILQRSAASTRQASGAAISARGRRRLQLFPELSPFITDRSANVDYIVR